MTVEVWLQGGPADDCRWNVVGNLDRIMGDSIFVIEHPAAPNQWLIVEKGWPHAIEYVRQPSVEQFTHERIYYPAAWGARKGESA